MSRQRVCHPHACALQPVALSLTAVDADSQPPDALMPRVCTPASGLVAHCCRCPSLNWVYMDSVETAVMFTYTLLADSNCSQWLPKRSQGLINTLVNWFLSTLAVSTAIGSRIRAHAC